MKKLIAMLVCFILVASLAMAGMTTASADGIKLTMMMNCSEADPPANGYKELIKRFNETNPDGITVECTFYANSDYKTALSTMMAADSEPDIVFAWELGYLGNFVNGGKIVSLQSYLDADEEWKATFNDGVLPLLTYGGEIYGIPAQQCLGVMFYNTRIFAENGLEVPTTYEEFLNVCQTLKDNGITPIALASTASDAWLVSQYIQEMSNGIGGYELFDSLYQETGAWNAPAFVEAAQNFQKEVEAGYYEDGFTGVTGDEAREFFRMGMTAMYFNGSWELSNVGDASVSPEAENISCFVIPKINPENTGVTLGSVDVTLSVTKNCENVDAAVEFLKFFTSEESSTYMAYNYGKIPCLKWDLDETKISPLFATVSNLIKEQKNMTPWLDRVNADFGNEFNNQSVAVANGDEPQACFDALQAYVESRK